MGMTLMVAGCQTAKIQKSQPDEDLKNLAIQAQKDPEARSALQSVQKALSEQQGVVKFCPVDGEHFSAQVEFCPKHNVKLELAD